MSKKTEKQIKARIAKAAKIIVLTEAALADFEAHVAAEALKGKPKPAKKTLPERIDKALNGRPMTYDSLALKVFPPDKYPRAWKNATGGGPPGCYMALSAALRRGKFDVDLFGPGPSGRTVHPRRKPRVEFTADLVLDFFVRDPRAARSKRASCNVCGNTLVFDHDQKVPECPRCHWVVCETCEAPHAETCGEEAS